MPLLTIIMSKEQKEQKEEKPKPIDFTSNNWYNQIPVPKVYVEDWKVFGYPDEASWDKAYDEGENVFYNYWTGYPPQHTCAEYFGISYEEYQKLREYYKTNGHALRFVPNITEYTRPREKIDMRNSPSWKRIAYLIDRHYNEKMNEK